MNLANQTQSHHLAGTRYRYLRRLGIVLLVERRRFAEAERDRSGRKV